MEQEKKEALVIHYFFSLHDNTVKNIAQLTQLEYQKVSKIINKHLKNKLYEPKS